MFVVSVKTPLSNPALVWLLQDVVSTIDIPNLLIALDSCELTDSVLPMKFIDFELVVSKLDIYKEFFIKLILCFKELTQTWWQQSTGDQASLPLGPALSTRSSPENKSKTRFVYFWKAYMKI